MISRRQFLKRAAVVTAAVYAAPKSLFDTLVERAAPPSMYQSVATIEYVGNRAIVEHGIFSSWSPGIVFDQSAFSALNVRAGEEIQFTYTLTP